MLREAAFLLLVGVSATSGTQLQNPSSSVPSTKPSPTCTSSTSKQWLSTCDTTIFWPTSTDYFYGPTTGPGASAVSCNAQWVEYIGRASGLVSMGATSTSTITETYPSSTGACNTEVWPEGPGDPHTGPVTTLCDGIARALGPLEYSTSYWPGTGPCSTAILTSTDTTPVYRSPSPSPDCQLNSQDCIPIWETYTSRYYSYLDSMTTEIPGDTNRPIRPTACPTTKRNYTEQDPCTNCHYLPGTATLFYWPVSTVSGDLCLQNGSTVPATPTGEGPNTAIVDSHTFISPSIYASFTSIYARSNKRAHPGGSCGADHEDVIISIHPDALTSYRGHRNAKYPITGTPYPFNFAEFQPHEVGNYTLPLIPWDQYRGGAQCSLGGRACDMVRNDYRPWMGIPEGVMTQIDPRWTECDRLWYIPPVSLVPLVAGSMESRPTDVAEASVPQPASAVPVSALVASTPTATADW